MIINNKAELRAQLSQYPVTTRLSLTGTMIVARDIGTLNLIYKYGLNTSSHI